MLTWPASTEPDRPASETVSSVPAPEIRTSSASSKTSAMRRIRSPSASQSRSTASKMNSSYCPIVMPASCAPAAVGYSAITHGTSIAIVRVRNGRSDSCTAAWRSSDRSEPSRAFSGAQMITKPSAWSQIVRCSDEASRSISTGALRANGPPTSSNASCSSVCPPLRATCSTTASISGRASGVERITICAPGRAGTDRSISSRAYSSIRGSRIAAVSFPRRAGERQRPFGTVVPIRASSGTPRSRAQAASRSWSSRAR